MKKSTVPLFIAKTWEMLHSETDNPTIRWSPAGDCFQITNETHFVEEVLPRYFKHANMSSFIRQLNMYNFHKKKTEGGYVEFRHKLFRKNQQILLQGIKRKPSQADLRLGDQLIKQFAKENGEEVPRNSQEKEGERNEKEGEGVPKEDKSGIQFICVGKEPVAQPRAILGVCWTENEGQFNALFPKKIKNTIIKKPPSFFQSENVPF